MRIQDSPFGAAAVLCVLLLVSCASAPPELDYRLGARKHTACNAVAVAPGKQAFAALCDVLVRERMSGRDINETLEIISLPNGMLVDRLVLNTLEVAFGPVPRDAELEFSPDGSRIALITGSGRFFVLDATTLQTLTHSAHTDTIASALAFAATNEYLAVAYAGTPQTTMAHVIVYRVADMAEATRISINSGEAISALAFSPDASKLAIAAVEESTPLVRIYDWPAATLVDTVVHTRPVTALILADESRLVTLSDDLKVFEWRQAEEGLARYERLGSTLAAPGLWALQGSEVQAARLAPLPLPSMTLSPDGRLVAVSDATDTINIIDLEKIEFRCATGVAAASRGTAGTAAMAPLYMANPYPGDLDWLDDGSSIVATFAAKGMQLVGIKCGNTAVVSPCDGLRVQAGADLVSVDDKSRRVLNEELERAFFGSGLFRHGDLAKVVYQLSQFEKGSAALWILTSMGGPKVAISAEFYDADDNLLLRAEANSGHDFQPDVDTLGEGMSGTVRIPLRRVSESLARQAATRFGCGAGG